MLATGRLAGAHVFVRAVAVADASGDHRMYALAAIGLGGVQVQEQRADEDRRGYQNVLRRALGRLAADDSGEAASLRVFLKLRLAAERASEAADLDDARAAAGRAARGRWSARRRRRALAPARVAARARIREGTPRRRHRDARPRGERRATSCTRSSGCSGTRSISCSWAGTRSGPSPRCVPEPTRSGCGRSSSSPTRSV